MDGLEDGLNVKLTIFESITHENLLNLDFIALIHTAFDVPIKLGKFGTLAFYHQLICAKLAFSEESFLPGALYFTRNTPTQLNRLYIHELAIENSYILCFLCVCRAGDDAFATGCMPSGVGFNESYLSR